MKIMVTGANGLLGQHLVAALMNAGYTVIATGKGDNRLPPGLKGTHRYYSADITDRQATREIIRLEEPTMIVHAAAMTQVDDCQLRRDLSFEINVLGTINLLAAAKKTGSHFMYISTDFVFDGGKGKYSEEDARGPVNWYGFTKAQAEKHVGNSPLPWAIVRTGLVYGRPLEGARSNIVTWVKEKLEKGEKIRVVSDQVRTPTYVEDLANGIRLMVKKAAQGTFHIAGADILTPYEVAMRTAGLLGLDGNLVEKVDAASFSQPGIRPPITDLLIGKARKELDYEPLSFERGLEKMLL